MTNTCTKVFLRRRPYVGGKVSLYLDYYPAIRNPHTNKMTRRETLGIVIYAEPANEMQRRFNQEMEEKAEAIRCIRYQSLINEQFGFLDKAKQKMDFLSYFEKKAKSKYDKWMCVYLHFKKFCGGSCTFGDVTASLCEDFREYLLYAHNLRHPDKKIPLSNNSAAGYWSTFRCLLKMAYKEKYITENVNDFLEGIKWQEVKKEYLTLGEMKILDATECEVPVLKRASMFGLFTGLRLSDLLQLRWENIERSPDGGYCIRLCTEKTDTEATLPVSDEALKYCGERGEGLIFKGFRRSMAQQPFKKWVKAAGIEKKLSFHCLRHSFATILISLGIDVYVVSKMLTHRSVRTTQIYADVVSEKKREASNAITLK